MQASLSVGRVTPIRFAVSTGFSPGLCVRAAAGGSTVDFELAAGVVVLAGELNFGAALSAGLAVKSLLPGPPSLAEGIVVVGVELDIFFGLPKALNRLWPEIGGISSPPAPVLVGLKPRLPVDGVDAAVVVDLGKPPLKKD